MAYIAIELDEALEFKVRAALWSELVENLADPAIRRMELASATVQDEIGLTVIFINRLLRISAATKVTTSSRLITRLFLGSAGSAAGTQTCTMRFEQIIRQEI